MNPAAASFPLRTPQTRAGTLLGSDPQTPAGTLLGSDPQTPEGQARGAVGTLLGSDPQTPARPARGAVRWSRRLAAALFAVTASGCEFFGGGRPGDVPDEDPSAGTGAPAPTDPGTSTGTGAPAPTDPGIPVPEGADPRTLELAAAAESAQRVSLEFEALVAQGVTDPIDRLLAAQAGEAELSEDGGTVIVTAGTAFPVGVLTDSKERDEWAASDLGGLQGALEGADGGIVCQEATHPRSKTACVVTAFQGEFGQSLGEVDGSLRRAGYTTKTLRLSTPADVFALREALPGCGVLYLSSHGGVSKAFDSTRGNLISTEIPLAGDPKSPGLHQDLLTFTERFGGELPSWLGVIAHKGRAYWALTPAFFASVEYPNTLVYADACHSGRAVSGGTSLRDSFRGRGAGAFLGWSGAISTRFANPAADAIFEGLAGRPLTIDSLTLVTNPADPAAGTAYTPSAVIAPPSPDVALTLTVSGTDGYSMINEQSTDAAGHVMFAAVPGGASEVVDTLTVVAGGARTTTEVSAVVSGAELQKIWSLPFNAATETRSTLVTDTAPGFNLICANTTLAKTSTIVKF